MTTHARLPEEAQSESRPDGHETEARSGHRGGGGGGSHPTPSDESLVGLHRTMVVAELLDDRLAGEARRGTLESWRPGGCEAVLAGTAWALSPADWLFAGAADFAAAVALGVPLETAMAHVFATGADPTKGRVPAPRLAARTPPLGSYGFHNGAHLTHAAGVAWGAKIKGDGAVAVALFDEAEVASGEFHNALNFAGVFKLPVVFVAVRSAEGMLAGPRVAGRGVAYGVASVVCDGADVLAVESAVGSAIARARRGEGAMLVDAVVDASPGAAVMSFERVLEARGLGASIRATREAIARELDEAIARAPGAPPPASTMFDDVYAKVPAHLEEQRRGDSPCK